MKTNYIALAALILTATCTAQESAEAQTNNVGTTVTVLRGLLRLAVYAIETADAALNPTAETERGTLELVMTLPDHEGGTVLRKNAGTTNAVTYLFSLDDPDEVSWVTWPNANGTMSPKQYCSREVYRLLRRDLIAAGFDDQPFKHSFMNVPTYVTYVQPPSEPDPALVTAYPTRPAPFGTEYATYSPAGYSRPVYGGYKPVHVNSYFRRDGTFVHSHNRAAPGHGSHSSGSRGGGRGHR